ncbi:MAG: efflux RND transporter permease subunit [Thermoanaerobaculia bacterium]
MKIVEGAIRSPVKTAVGAILVGLFGTIALLRIPVQLTPTVEEPQITVTTLWPGASPHEIEQEIVDEQEEQLKSLEGLVEMESTSSDSFGQINLTFLTGTELDSALLKVSNHLEQVPRYPEDAEKPLIQAVGANAGAMAWFVLLPSQGEDAFTGDITTQLTFVEEFVKPEFERVSGVGQVNVMAGREEEMHVIVDPAKLASRQITITEFVAAINRENRNYSAGDFDEGKRRYIVRTMGEYESAKDIEDVVVTIRNGVPVYVRDVARAELGYQKPFANAYFLGEQMIVFNAIRETGANILEVMKGLKSSLRTVNHELLEPRGLRVLQVWDQTDYIYSAIGLVRQSLLLGGLLAIMVLLVFLRSRSSTLVIAIAIPISIIGTFLMMNWFGRTLNVISLAGMAFAVGMVVDNSIVVLENIYRHRQMGKSRFQAAHDGATEVWGAVLASTLTTIAVFLPVLFVQEEAGQLFRDIAIAISCAVGLSLIVAITVIPSLSAKILGVAEREAKGKGYRELWGVLGFAQRINDWVTDRVYWITGSTTRRLAVVVGFTAAAVGLSFLLMPATEYLPTGNQNLLFGFILPPPGYSLVETSNLRHFYDEVAYLWETPAEEAEELPGGGVDRMFYVGLPNQAFMGVTARDPSRVRELTGPYMQANFKMPGSIAFISQASLFERGLGRGRSIDVELTGPELPQLIALGGEVFQRVRQVLPGAQARPIPSLDLGNPEVHVRTHRRRAAELGITNRDLGLMVNVLVDGAKASDYRHEGREIDLMVKADKVDIAQRTHLVEQLPLAAPSGELVTLASVADVEVSMGPAQIAHRERQRAITIAVSPSEEMPLQAAMEAIESEILDPMRQEDKLGGLYRVQLSGTADKLTQTGRALMWNFILAVIITYLLMAALFESFLYPFVILFSVPLAALGGFLGLAVTNIFTYQALDVLTMLGFIILVGTVVNNAILIVHQSLNHMRNDGLAPREAIREAVGNRIRPIFMSVSTSVCGMLPLILFPGAGSELYRGLGSVVVGGLIVSTVFTLFLVPALFSLVLEARDKITARLRRPADTPPAEATV